MNEVHPLAACDFNARTAFRELASASKGVILGAESRPMFDAMRAATPSPDGINFGKDMIGGVSGWWCRPVGSNAKECILFLHGGGYVLGSARSMLGFAGQIASRSGMPVFVADYRLAPEHPFPAAIDDAVAAYRGLVATGSRRILLAGDSAGGGLALALLAIVAQLGPEALPAPLGAAVFSPWTDLSLSAPSMSTRADADPIFTKAALSAFADAYLQGADPGDARASPLGARLAGLPPVRIDVGDDEILLDDATRFAERARGAGTVVDLATWLGMHHVFPAALDRFSAARSAMDAAARFLRACTTADNARAPGEVSRW